MMFSVFYWKIHEFLGDFFFIHHFHTKKGFNLFEKYSKRTPETYTRKIRRSGSIVKRGGSKMAADM